MKKLIATILFAIIVSTGFSTFAQTTVVSRVHIKSIINTAGTGNCLDIANGQTTAGNPMVQFDCHNGYNQLFSIIDQPPGYNTIQSDLNPGMCVGITNNVNANSNELLRLVPCFVANTVPRGARFYLEFVNGRTRFVAYSFSRDGQRTCIDIPSGDARNSVWLQLYYCHQGANQLWDVR